MTQRAPRNIVSKTDVLSIRAAELLDDGMTDAQVAKALTAEFCGKPGSPVQVAVIKRETVMAFRHRDYERIAKERKDRQADAAETRLVLAGAKDAGMDFAAMGLSDFARTIKQVLKLKREAVENGAAVDLEELSSLGRSLAAVAKELKNLGKREVVEAAERVTGNDELTAEEKAMRMREIFGMPPKA